MSIEIDKDKKRDPYAKLQEMGYVPGIGFAKSQGPATSAEAPTSKGQANTSSNTTFDNTNSTLTKGNVATDAQAGAGGANALVQAGRESGNSSGGSQQQGFSGGRHQDQALIRNDFAKGGLKAPSQVSFDFVSKTPEERQQETRIKGMQDRIIGQYETRYGISLNDDVQSAIRNMTDEGDLSSALKIMATGKRSDIQDPQVNALEQTIQTAYPDFFSAVSTEEVEAQRQRNQ
jgi:hypothetical protein